MEYQKPVLKIEKFEIIDRFCSEDEELSAADPFPFIDEENITPAYEALDQAIINVFKIDILP